MLVSHSWHGHTIEISSFASVGAANSYKPHWFLVAVDGNPPKRFVAPQDSVYKYNPEPTVASFEVACGDATHVGRFEWEPMFFKYTLTMDDEEIGSGVLRPEFPTDSCWVAIFVLMAVAATLILVSSLVR